MISVLLPTYARPEFLAESIECFLRQTHTDSELVIFNDWRGHTIQFDHPRVRVFNKQNEQRQTLGAIRNMLCELAHGDVVTDWDDDDLYLPDHLEHALSMMKLYRGGMFSKQRWQWKWRCDKSDKFRIQPAGYMHTVMMNRQQRMRMGGYADKTRHSDAELLNRIIMAKKLIGPPAFYHKPTFVQRFGTGRQHVSAGPTPDETDADRHIRIDREAEAIGLTGNVTIVPRWDADYVAIANDSFASVLKTEWGK